MHPVYEVLERAGLITDEHIVRISKMPIQKAEALHQELFDVIYKRQYANNESRDLGGNFDSFTFLASAAMRGDSGCAEHNCRSAKVDFLARFSALYATTVTIPLPLPMRDTKSHPESLKRALSLTFQTLLAMRPLVDAGFILPTVMRTAHCCQKHMENFQEFVEVMYDYTDSVVDDSLSLFSVHYQSPIFSPSGLHSIYIDGPEDYLEHGSLVCTWDPSDKFLSKPRKLNKEGMVALRGNEKKMWVYQIFEPIAENTSFYLAYGMDNRARLLTNLPGETFLLPEDESDEPQSRSARSMAALEHSLPILSELSIDTLLRIRLEERDSFEAYRRSIDEIAKAALTETVTDSELASEFRGKVLPNLEKLQHEMDFEKARQRNRWIVGVSSIAAGVAIGAIAGIPTIVKAPIVGALSYVGAKILPKTVESTCENGADLRESNDLYFLLKVLKAG